MPQARQINPVQHHVRQRNRNRFRSILPCPQRLRLQLLNLCRRGVLRHQMLERLDHETARATARIVCGFAQLWVHNLNDHPDDLARREELSAVVFLLAEARQQAFQRL